MTLTEAYSISCDYMAYFRGIFYTILSYCILITMFSSRQNTDILLEITYDHIFFIALLCFFVVLHILMPHDPLLSSFGCVFSSYSILCPMTFAINHILNQQKLACHKSVHRKKKIVQEARRDIRKTWTSKHYRNLLVCKY